MKKKIITLLFVLFFNICAFAQDVLFPIDSITQKIHYINSYLRNQKRQLLKVKNWVSKKFNIDYREINDHNKNNIKFINVIPIFTTKDSMGIIGELNYIVDIKIDSIKYIISLSSFKFIDNQNKDTIALESMINSTERKGDLNYNFIFYQINNHTKTC